MSFVHALQTHHYASDMNVGTVDGAHCLIDKRYKKKNDCQGLASSNSLVYTTS